MIETLKRNVVEAWLNSAPEVMNGVRDVGKFSEADLDGIFGIVEGNGARMHELVDLGSFLHGANDLMPASSYFRFSGLLKKAQAAQALYPSPDFADDIEPVALIEGGLRPHAYARLMSANDVGDKLPESYRDVVADAAIMDLRPALAGMAYISDSLHDAFQSVFYGGGKNSFARRKAEALINAAAKVLGVDVPKYDDEPGLHEVVRMAQLAEFAGFGADMVHDVLAGYLAAPETGVDLKNDDFFDASSSMFRNGERADREAALYSIGARYFERKGRTFQAETMSMTGASAMDIYSSGSVMAGRDVARDLGQSFLANAKRIHGIGLGQMRPVAMNAPLPMGATSFLNSASVFTRMAI